MRLGNFTWLFIAVALEREVSNGENDSIKKINVHIRKIKIKFSCEKQITKFNINKITLLPVE